MFLRDALLRCSELDDEAASVFADLCEASGPDEASAAALAASARAEREHAHLLRALAALADALDDDGPFLVQVPLQIAAFRRVLDAVRSRMSMGMEPDVARRCAERLQTAPFGELHRGLLELAAPQVHRVLGRIAQEIGPPVPRAARG